MKIALCFRFAQLFWLSKLSRGAISSNYREKFKGLKSIEQGYTEGTFSLPFKIPTLGLIGASPKPQKQEQMALASLVSFQKQKLTVVKIFMELDIEKAVFQRGNKRTFFMPLVDTRSLIQYKTNIITYGKTWLNIGICRCTLMIKAFQKFYIQF